MLRYAIVDQVSQLPFKGGKGWCPTCGSPVLAKCGSIKVHHWAHERREDCDAWSEPIGPWHLSWQALVLPEFREVTRGPHRADVVGNGGLVVELQHSNISTEDIQERERFYGEMVWLFDATNRFSLVESGHRVFFSFGKTKHLESCTKPVFLDFGDLLVEVEVYSQALPKISGFGLKRDRAWFVDRFLSETCVTDMTTVDPPWRGTSPISLRGGDIPVSHTLHRTRWKDTQSGCDLVLPRATPYIRLDFEWVNRISNDRRPIWPDIIEKHPGLANGWTVEDFKWTQSVLGGNSMIINGHLCLIPDPARDMRLETTVFAAETFLRQVEGHIQAGRIPVLKDETKRAVIDRARQYEIAHYGELLKGKREASRPKRPSGPTLFD
jgi:hypothetical protein